MDSECRDVSLTLHLSGRKNFPPAAFRWWASLCSSCLFQTVLAASLVFLSASVSIPASSVKRYDVTPLVAPAVMPKVQPIIKTQASPSTVAVVKDQLKFALDALARPRPPKILKPPEVTERIPQLDLPHEPPGEIALLKSKSDAPRRPVETGVLPTRDNELPRTNRAPSAVQTGGFGDPNGVHSKDSLSSRMLVSQAGHFDLPVGSGLGNGTGGRKGSPGVIVGTGFGISDSRQAGTKGAQGQAVGAAGFADASSGHEVTTKAAAPTPATTSPVEILSKPNPTYTEEARRLRIEGEVLIEVVFDARGHVRVMRVIDGLGHGLDEAAIRAAEGIQFKSAMVGGSPIDAAGTVHIAFRLAY